MKLLPKILNDIKKLSNKKDLLGRSYKDMAIAQCNNQEELVFYMGLLLLAKKYGVLGLN